MALMEVNFFSKALMRPVTMNVILPVDKVFFGEETEEENKPFKTLYLLHGVMGNYTDWVTGTCIKRWAEEKNRKKTLIINLPGSVKAVTESMEFLIGNMEHGLDILMQTDSECGRA